MRTGVVRSGFSGGLSRSCDIAEWRLILLRDNELPEAETAALRRHLQGCVRCRERYRFLDALMPAFAKDAEAASQVVRLPVSVSAELTALSLALSLVAGGLASYFMGRRTARMKPVDILRRL